MFQNLIFESSFSENSECAFGGNNRFEGAMSLEIEDLYISLKIGIFLCLSTQVLVSYTIVIRHS